MKTLYLKLLRRRWLYTLKKQNTRDRAVLNKVKLNDVRAS